MNTEHRHLTDADVWTLVDADCNDAEIAAYAGVRLSVAYAMRRRAEALYACGRLDPAADAQQEAA